MSRRTAIKAVLASGVGALTGVGTYSVLYAPDALELTEATLPIATLAPSLNGLRLGLITDVHRSRWVSESDVARAVAMMMAARPDLIVLGGDYITQRDRRYIGSSAEVLGTLSARHGVFAVMGNHDDEPAVAAALRAKGVQVLRDARTRLGIGSAGLELAGMSFWTKRAADLESIVRGAKDPIILIAHDPRRLSEAAALRIPVVLSGHTHGGQVVMPGVGAIAARKFPVVAGVGRQGATTIFVSRGVGTVYVPVRVNCPPEIAVLTLARTA